MPLDNLNNNDSVKMNMDNSSQIMMTLVSQLDRTLGSFESQLKDLTNVVKVFNKDFINTSKYSSYNKTTSTNFSEWNRQFGKSSFKELDKIFTDKIKNISDDVAKEQKEIDTLYKDFKKK